MTLNAHNVAVLYLITTPIQIKLTYRLNNWEGKAIFEA